MTNPIASTDFDTVRAALADGSIPIWAPYARSSLKKTIEAKAPTLIAFPV